jgi:hypothetical protein
VYISHQAGQKRPTSTEAAATSWRIVDYSKKEELIEVLRGTHTLLSFIQVLADTGNESQRNLIDAAIAAGVKRFAPSDYGRYVVAGNKNCGLLTHGQLGSKRHALACWTNRDPRVPASSQ